MITFTSLCDGEPIEVSQPEPSFLIFELPYDTRKKSRFTAESECGITSGFVLPRGHILRNGTWVRSEQKDYACFVAAPEMVSTIHHTEAMQLARAAYHLGNRHVNLQIGDGWLRYQHDHVLDDMLKGLGFNIEVERAPFEPEDGAYAHGHHASHGHHHDRSH